MCYIYIYNGPRNGERSFQNGAPGKTARRKAGDINNNNNKYIYIYIERER